LIEEEGFPFSDQIAGSLSRFALMPNKLNKQTKHLVEEKKGKERENKLGKERSLWVGRRRRRSSSSRRRRRLERGRRLGEGEE
jgi:hypothetical protein